MPGSEALVQRSLLPLQRFGHRHAEKEGDFRRIDPGGRPFSLLAVPETDW